MLINILYEDPFIIAVDKPNNMLVHHSKMANNQVTEKSLVQLLQSQINKTVYPAHRLDRKTSGIVLFVKDKKNIPVFQKLFLNQSIEKIYFGIVRGFTPMEGIIDSPVKGRDAHKHKEALTHYEQITTYEVPIPVQPYATSRYSLIKLTPKTGRLHQLRIHLNKISHPLIGDPKYGDRFHNRMFEQEFNQSNLFLHAQFLSFTHPMSLKTITLKSAFPEHWLHAIEKLNSYKPSHNPETQHDNTFKSLSSF